MSRVKSTVMLAGGGSLEISIGSLAFAFRQKSVEKKHQTPNTKHQPTSKYQIPKKFLRRHKRQSWCLEFGGSLVFDVWCLEFFISISIAHPHSIHARRCDSRNSSTSRVSKIPCDRS